MTQAIFQHDGNVLVEIDILNICSNGVINESPASLINCAMRPSIPHDLDGFSSLISHLTVLTSVLVKLKVGASVGRNLFGSTSGKHSASL